MGYRCKWCKRPAVFKTAKNQQVRGDAEHDLCARCFRDAQNRNRSRKLKRGAVLLPVLAVLFALPTFAQDVAAPAAPAGVSPVVAFLVDHLFELLASTVLPAVFLWVRTHTKGTAFESSAAVVESYLVSRVALVKPLVLEALANDGKIDAGELQRIRDAVLRDLPAGLLAPLQTQLGGGFVAWLEGMVTRLVEDSVRKEAAAAGTKAAAAVPDADAAIAAVRAQRAAVTP